MLMTSLQDETQLRQDLLQVPPGYMMLGHQLEAHSETQSLTQNTQNTQLEQVSPNEALEQVASKRLP